MMYPLLPLAILGLIRQNKDILIYIFLITIPGTALEMYHYLMQKLAIPNPFGCTAANPCAALKVDYFDFITIPFLCLVAFVVIFVVSLMGLRAQRKQ